MAVAVFDGGLTVSVAEVLKTVPAALLARARNCAVLSLACALASV